MTTEKMRLTKIYTKVGDKGTTLLATGERIEKSAPRIEAYGTVDELNAVIGLLRDHLMIAPNPAILVATQRLLRIQNELFDLGAELSTPLRSLDTSRQSVIHDEHIMSLEREMDEMNASLSPLANFVLPGGHPANSFCHLARTVCRRAERRVVAFGHTEEIRPATIIYLNRLSDWLFVLGRHVSKCLDVGEVLWSQKRVESKRD